METNNTYSYYLLIIIAALVTGLGNVGRAVTVTIGEQDFADGYIVSGSVSEFNSASVGEPAPFDLFYGSDYGTPFSASWTFNYSPLTVTDTILTLGIVDHDSAAPGSQVSSFIVDSIDITSLLDIEFESHGGAQIEANVYTIILPASTFSALSDGIATFNLTLQGPGLQYDNTTTPGNGAGLDFCTLNVVPEPGTLALLGLGGLALRRKRRA